jgi:murein DD-endopeptidase MepM/ murein hydrolase activator NlpD
MANRFFTILIVPEKTAKIRRIIIPGWIVKSGLAVMILCTALVGIMFMDYWYVMSQVNENKQLKMENRRLRQQVQVFRNKMTTVESTLERIKTFATRLKVITNIEDRSSLIQSLNEKKLPDASTNIGTAAATVTPVSATTETIASTEALPDPVPAPAPSNLPFGEAENPEDVKLRKDYETLDFEITTINQDSMLVEQILQDQYELLADQKAFLAALPVRKPSIGYFTSGFGIRKSPYGDGRPKMHEGLDIANYPGTTVKAPADGTVTFVGTKSGYGQTLVIDHGYGLETWYAHNRRIAVSKGQTVRRGDMIASMGSNGRSTGPHLHYEVRVHGIPVDPLSYILEN